MVKNLKIKESLENAEIEKMFSEYNPKRIMVSNKKFQKPNYVILNQNSSVG